RSSWRPGTAPTARSTVTPWPAPWRSCASGSTSWAWPSRPCNARGSGGGRGVLVELPGVYAPAEAVEVIGRTAQLSFHPVLGLSGQGDTDGDGLRLGPAALTGAAGGDARAGLDPPVQGRRA